MMLLVLMLAAEEPPPIYLYICAGSGIAYAACAQSEDGRAATHLCSHSNLPPMPSLVATQHCSAAAVELARLKSSLQAEMRNMMHAVISRYNSLTNHETL